MLLCYHLWLQNNPNFMSAFTLYFKYHISSLIRRHFFSFQNNPKNLDLSYQMDLDLWDCLGRVKPVLQQNCIGLI